MDKTIKILAVAAIIIFSIQSFSNNKADVDLWGNVGFVKALPWSQEFHRTNTFSFTEPEHTWINHEWLAEYIFNKVYLIAGSPGLIALKILIGLLIAALLNISIKKHCDSGLLRFLLLMLMISTIGYGFSIRPHLFTYLMLTIFLTTLQNLDKNRLLILAALPLLGLVWVNFHGAFFIGIILTLIFTCTESIKVLSEGRFTKERRYIMALSSVLLFLIAVSFINPYGADLWKFILNSATAFRPYLSEWAPFNPVLHFTDHTDFMALALLSFASLLFSKKPKDITWSCILLIAFLSALLLRRNIPIFAIVACFVIPEHLEDAAGKPLDGILKLLPKTIIPILLCLFIPVSAWYSVMVKKTTPSKVEIPQDRFPSGVISFIKDNNIKGNMLVFFDWAEYCIWKLYPDCRVFLDGRFTDAYSMKTVTDYLNFLYLGSDWDLVLKNYPVDMILIHKGNPVYKKIPYLKNWQLVSEDGISGLFLNTSVHSMTISRLSPAQPIIIKGNSAELFP